MIKVLDKSVSDKIAAGEVVERPLSIVKELFENSIDSGADNIIVEIANGGKSYIRITDNGCGIASQEVQTAFLRHATSKLAQIDDLNSLHTLGFRGEALASICAVTRMEVITKTPQENYGTKMIMDGGDLIDKGKYGAPDGTTMIVRDLFFNTPAREKFLGSDRKEASLIISFVSQMAVAYPDVKIQLVNNNNILFTTPGRGDRVNTFATVGSNKLIEDLLYFQEDLDGMKLQGYISNPGDSKANRRGQVIFVNGRVVETKVVTKGIDLAYADRLFEGRFPSAYLFLEVDPGSIDVNIHPNKRSIKFYDGPAVTDFVYQSIRRALKSREAVPEMRTKSSQAMEEGMDKCIDKVQPKFATGEEYESFRKDKDIAYVSGDEADKKRPSKTANKADKTNSSGLVREPDRTLDQLEPSEILEETKLKSEDQADPSVEEENTGPSDKSEKEDFLDALHKHQEEKIENKINEQVKFDLASQSIERTSKIGIGQLQLMGQAFNTYIIAKDDEAVYLIDQHAAQERVFFEEFRALFKEDKPASQPLLLPFIVEIDIANMDEFTDKVEQLISMGFDMEAFGPSSYRVRAIPHIFAEDQAKDFIEDFIAHMGEYGDFESKGVMDKIASRACKASIKANHKLTDAEMRQLMLDLEGCENPFSCPHGRPTFLKMTKSQIESRFLRK